MNYKTIFEYREEIIQTKPKKLLYFLKDTTYNIDYPSWTKDTAYHKKQSITYYLLRNIFSNNKLN